MRLNKIISFIFFCFLNNTAQAAPGFYVGGGAGYDGLTNFPIQN